MYTDSMRSVAVSPEVSRRVSRYDYGQQLEDIDSLLTDLKQVMLEGNYILSKDVAVFEASFAAYCQCQFGRGVNSGTDALLIALRALGIGPGDEVITVANTFHATVAAIELAGATPVLIDADDSTFLLDDQQLAGAVSPRTRAVIPVHLFGKPVKMTPLLEFAERRGLLLIEDAAQAHGACTDGKRVGSFGAAGCFSFHPSKNLAAAGDAGAIVTNDAELADKIDLFRALGQRAQNDHVAIGFNSKLDGIQARILDWKLRRLDEWNRSRASIAGRYREALCDLPVSFQATDPTEIHVYHLFQLRLEQRDGLLEYLRTRGIDAVVRYPTPIHLQPAFHRRGWKRGEFRVSEALADQLLCLPIRPVMHEEEIETVIEGVRAFFSEGRG